MSYNRRENEINYEQIAAFLKASVQQVKTEEDVEVLSQLKKVFKKNVPLTLRSYVAAYLLKIATGNARRPYVGRNNRETTKENFRRNDFRNKQEFTSETANTEERTHTPRPHVTIDPSQATTIFIGIGRNRRVYPRDLVGLLISVAGLERDRIGDIRVLANYSFIQLFTEDADKAINALNGYDYRGRKLSVSYSRQKEEGEDTAEADSQTASYEPTEEEKADAAAYAAAERAATNEAFSSPVPSNEN